RPGLSPFGPVVGQPDQRPEHLPSGPVVAIGGQVVRVLRLDRLDCAGRQPPKEVRDRDAPAAPPPDPRRARPPVGAGPPPATSRLAASARPARTTGTLRGISTTANGAPVRRSPSWWASRPGSTSQ